MSTVARIQVQSNRFSLFVPTHGSRLTPQIVNWIRFARRFEAHKKNGNACNGSAIDGRAWRAAAIDLPQLDSSELLGEFLIDNDRDFWRSRLQ